MTAAAWLGVLRAHQSRAGRGAGLAAPRGPGQMEWRTPRRRCTRCCSPGTRTRWPARPALALAAFTRYTAEVERRQVPRFAGRAVNFAGWVLRNLGAPGRRLLIITTRRWRSGSSQGTAEVTIAALEDLAEQCVEAGDPDGAQARLAQARALLYGRPGLRLAAGPQAPAASPGGWRCCAATRRRRWPRPATWHAPGGGAGRPAVRQRGPRPGAPGPPGAGPAGRPGRGRRGPGPRGGAVAVEAWWWTGETAADFGGPRPGWTGPPSGPNGWPRPGRRATRIRCGGQAARRLDGWRAAAG